MRINRSTSRTIDILELISRKNDSLTITEISKTLGIPKSSTLEILHTLMQMNIVEIDKEKLKTFRLGLRLFEIVLSALAKTDLHRETRPLLEGMMSQSGETVFLAVENQGEMVYLDKVEGPSMLRTTADLGSRLPMHCTALGKALLAAYPEEKVREIIQRRKLISRTKNTITRYADLVEELKATRERGYSIDNEEDIADIFCVGAPVYDQTSKPIASISIASQASKMTRRRIEKFGGQVQKVGLDISRKLGFQGDRLFF
jgi:DNA-binding IclR family transcriptional regulator